MSGFFMPKKEEMMTDTADVHYKGRGFAMLFNEVVLGIKDAKAIALYAILMAYAQRRPGDALAHPTRSTLAAQMGHTTPKAVDKALETLKGLGLVEVLYRFRDADGNISYARDEQFNRQTSNGYILHDVIRRDGAATEGVKPAAPVVVGTETSTPMGTEMAAHLGTQTATPRAPKQLPPGYPNGDPPGTRTGTQIITTKQEPVELEPLTNSLTSPSGEAGDDTGGLFDDFWATYPRRVGKKAARAAWAKAIKTTAPSTIIEAAARYAATRVGKDPTYTPHPTTWLNAGRWDDELTPDLSPGQRKWAAAERLKDRPDERILAAAGMSPELDRMMQEAKALR